MEIVKMNVLNVTTRIGESESLTKHISCDCECRFDSKKCYSGQEWNKELCRCQCKSPVTSFVWKRVCLESSYTCLQDW